MLGVFFYERVLIHMERNDTTGWKSYSILSGQIDPSVERENLLSSGDTLNRDHTLEPLQKTSGDSGRIECPLLRPTLKLKIFEKDGFVLLFNDGGSLTLKGKLYVDILPLLNGKNSWGELCEELGKKDHPEMMIKTVLYRLSSMGLILSGEHQLSEEQANWWTTCGLSPLQAQKLLEQWPLYLQCLSGVEADIPHLQNWQSRGGWKLTSNPGEAALIVYFIAGDGRQELAKVNAAHFSDKRPWCFLHVIDQQKYFLSPVFDPRDKNSPCWQCMHSQLERGAWRIPYRYLSPPDAPSMVEESMLQLIHGELSAWLAAPTEAPLSNHLICSNFPHNKVTQHYVGRRPQCQVCGDSTLDTPKPIELKPRTIQSHTSGGVRHLTPQQVWSEYRKLVDPLTGVVSKLDAFTEEDGGIFITNCDANVAVQQWNLKGLKAGFRMNSSGKGTHLEQSQVGALCESLERHAGCFQKEEEHHISARYKDFAEGEAILPNQLMLFSEEQFRNRKEINGRKISFYQVTEPFDEASDEKLLWTPVWSLTEKRFKHLMTQQLYYNVTGHPQIREPFYANANSNGCAGGSCLEDAIVQGTYELIERDAFALWWYNRLQYPGVDIDSFNSPWIQRVQKYYNKIGRRTWALNLTHDFEIPCFVAFSMCEEGTPFTTMGAGAHSNPTIALSRAIAESNQTYISLEPWSPHSSHVQEHFDTVALEWFNKANPWKDESYRYILPSQQKKATKLEDFSSPQHTDALEEVLWLKNKIEEKGMEMLVQDQTRPDINYPVARVIVPGMRHFWCQLGPGRLYQVPVEMGWLEKPLTEEQLNPMPLFF